MQKYRIVENGITPHFVTWTIIEWLPIFISEAYCKILVDSLEYCRREKNLLVHGYVFMPTHIHAILSVKDGGELSAVVRDARKFTAHKIAQQLVIDNSKLFVWIMQKNATKDGRPEGSHKVWTDSTHPMTLESEKFVLQKLQYMHNNPVRKGLVALPEYWQHSSAAFYIHGQKGPLELDAFEW